MNKLIFIRYSRSRIIAENVKKINTLPKNEIQRILHTIDTFCSFIVPTKEEYQREVAREQELIIIRQENQERENLLMEIQRNALIAAAKAGEVSAVRYMIFHS